VTGTGGDFSAGADLTVRWAADIHPVERMRRVNLAALALHELPKPTVAKVEGVAVGAGCNLALGCDLVLAATDARFSQIFAGRGLSLDFGGSWLLPRLIGLQRAKRLAFTSEFVSGQEAYDLGLVAWALAPEKLGTVVDEIVTNLAAGPPVALARTKAMLNAAGTVTMAQALDAEALSQVANFATTDTGVAVRAFAERTEPVFSGRWSLSVAADENEERG
jgi:2-(1,2-epoxy-1,2-dihydrophenyl)acetyl-CoA isomerase